MGLCAPSSELLTAADETPTDPRCQSPDQQRVRPCAREHDQVWGRLVGEPVATVKQGGRNTFSSAEGKHSRPFNKCENSHLLIPAAVGPQ